MAVSSHRKRVGSLEKELDEHKSKVAELEKPKPVNPLDQPVEPPKSQE